MQSEENFDTIEYLKHGNDRQIQVFNLLRRHRILEQLTEFDPIVVGTIPINIDIESSDIDIICYYNNKTRFADKIVSLFEKQDGFRIWENDKIDQGATVATFTLKDFTVEIFGQNIPTRQQMAYRHMLIENNILLEKGEEFRKRVIELKQQGLKTEPAFAFLLELEGDPYIELLQL
jgi:hypothetical protein